MSTSAASTNDTKATTGFDQEEDWEMPAAGMRSEEERTQEELSRDLYKVEEEIRTLRQVLDAKERKAAVLRKKLGISPLQLMGKDVTESIKSIRETSGNAVSKVRESETVQKLNEASRSAVTNAASYTKSSLSTLNSGMKHLRLNMFGVGNPSTSSTSSATTVLSPDATNDALFAGAEKNSSTASDSSSTANKGDL